MELEYKVTRDNDSCCPYQLTLESATPCGIIVLVVFWLLL